MLPIVCTSFYISLQDNPERIVTTEKVFWLSGLYSVCPLVIMVISYSLICYKIKLSNNTLLCQQTKTFNKHKSEVRIILYPKVRLFLNIVNRPNNLELMINVWNCDYINTYFTTCAITSFFSGPIYTNDWNYI